jgi:predicted dehydrogenase
MGKRRLRLLSEHKDIELFGVDSQTARIEEVKAKFGIPCYASIEEACRQQTVDAAVVSTSPLSHAAIIKECLERGLHVFTEINLVDTGYDENIALAAAKGKVLFLSSTFLYQEETKKMIEKVHTAQGSLNYIYHVGQYLPDWHPWESYNNYFIGDKRTNGCREIMAIDLPWIVTAFGPIKDVKVVKSKNTSLNIRYNDSYLMLLQHENGTNGMFAVDVVARKPYRHIDIYGEQFQMSWNGTIDSLYEYDIEGKQMVNIPFAEKAEHIEGYAEFISENPYREETNAYLHQIARPDTQPAWDFVRDRVVLELINKIETE